ncbi:hypothetical protein PN836_005735 [Ningiella sp. W23]|uniref:hypothetical protein n=1 Tax=Ningiella sp. W23 TaxID=3023715 RepID=UPI0037563C71
MNKLSRLVILLCFVTSVQAVSGAKADLVVSKDNQSPSIKESPLYHYAELVGLSVDEYARLQHTLRDVLDEDKVPGFSLESHPALLQYISLVERGGIPSLTLEDEVAFLMEAYKKGLADYVGVSVIEYTNAMKKMAILEASILRIYDIDRRALAIEGDDPPEVIVVVASLEEARSGGRSGNTMTKVYAQASRLIGNSWNAKVNVRFQNRGGDDFGYQSWRVSNFAAWPDSSFVCSRGMCSL